MEGRVYETVWYRRRPRSLRPSARLTYEDVGYLRISQGGLEFHGRTGTLSIDHVRRISFGFRGSDVMNRWIDVEFGTTESPNRALFKDGTGWGWFSIFGASKTMIRSIEEATGVRCQQARGFAEGIRIVLAVILLAGVPILTAILGNLWIGMGVMLLAFGGLIAEVFLNRLRVNSR
jgi:hypothetical protein